MSLHIAGCLIVKDDSEYSLFKKATISLAPYVDSIHITTNGKRVKKIKQYCDKQGWDYSHLPWDDDFSKQRIFNFSQAPSYTDFIFWMDADDILVGGEYLRSIAEIAKTKKKEVVYLTYWYGCTFDGEPSLETIKKIDIQHLRERLIKPGTTTWKGRLHETPVVLQGARDVYSKLPYDQKSRPIAVLHTKPYEAALKTLERNKRILELQLEEERKTNQVDPRTLLYLMKIYAEDDRPEILQKVINMGYEYLELSGWDQERAVSYSLMSVSMSKLQKHKEAVDLLHEAIKEFPHDPHHYIRLAVAYYNLKKLLEARHWIEIGANMEMKENSTGIALIQEMKVLTTDLLSRLKMELEKDIDAALEFAKMTVQELDTPSTNERVMHLENLKRFNDACRNTHQLLIYLDEIGYGKAIPGIVDMLPEPIKEKPFAINLRRRFSPPRVWGDNEVCFFANFARPHFEKWSPDSLKTGIGGSETAVIELAKRWSEKGYKVTVYGDPVSEGNYDGVAYLSYIKFDHRDYFNIFIQWRSAFMVPNIKAKKVLIDLHDMYNPIDLVEAENHVDYFMFKSNYHKELTSALDTNKCEVIGNGIS